MTKNVRQRWNIPGMTKKVSVQSVAISKNKMVNNIKLVAVSVKQKMDVRKRGD